MSGQRSSGGLETVLISLRTNPRAYYITSGGGATLSDIRLEAVWITLTHFLRYLILYAVDNDVTVITIHLLRC